VFAFVRVESEAVSVKRLPLSIAEQFVSAVPSLSSLNCGFCFVGYYRTFPVPNLWSLTSEAQAPLRWKEVVYVPARLRLELNSFE
jgi:hypothetical protein